MPDYMTGSLVVSFTNTCPQQSELIPYHFILIREREPEEVVHTFRGKLTNGAIQFHRLESLMPGNYLLLGLTLPDPRPGNDRVHRIMIYPGLETVYDVNYSRCWEKYFQQ